jgi:hypothetical protein
VGDNSSAEKDLNATGQKSTQGNESTVNRLEIFDLEIDEEALEDDEEVPTGQFKDTGELDILDELQKIQDFTAFNLFRRKFKKVKKTKEWRVDLMRRDDEISIEFLQK